MPDMKRLFDNVGISLTQDETQISFGASIRKGKVYNNTSIGSPAYEAGLENGDKIIQIDDYVLSDTQDFNSIITKFKPRDVVKVIFERLGETKEATLTFKADQSYAIKIQDDSDEVKRKARDAWLNSKQ
jgi:predicted metalloprotease with PDZ domain